jgi:hypothetical protein
MNNKRSFPHESDDLYRPLKKRTYLGGGPGVVGGHIIPMSSTDLNDVKADLKQALYHIGEALRTAKEASSDLLHLQPLADAEEIIQRFVKETIGFKRNNRETVCSRPFNSEHVNRGGQRFVPNLTNGRVIKRGVFTRSPQRFTRSPPRFNTSAKRFDRSPPRFKRDRGWNPMESKLPPLERGDKRFHDRIEGRSVRGGGRKRQGNPKVRTKPKVKSTAGQLGRVKTPRNGNRGLPTPASISQKQVLAARKPKKKTELKKCDICNITCNSESQWVQHVGGLAHQARLKGEEPPSRIKTEDQANKPPAPKVRCKICNLNLRESDYKHHINGKKHLRKLSIKEKQDDERGFEKGTSEWVLQCKVCRSSWNGEVQFAEHLSGKQHQQALERKETDRSEGEQNEENMTTVLIGSKSDLDFY